MLKTNKVEKPKILVLAPTIPKPDVASGDLRFFSMLQVLAKNNIVDFLITEDHHAQGLPEYKRRLRKTGVNVLRHGTLGLDQAALRRTYDIVFFEFWRCAAECLPAIRSRQPQAQVVIDSVDIHFVREEAGLAFGVLEASLVSANKQNEIKTYRKADLVIVVTQEDRDALSAEQVTVASMAIPNIVPIHARLPMPRASELLFVGGFQHPPNKDGLLWFNRECWPKIKASMPEATLTVVGSNVPQEIQDLSRQDEIEVVGFVPDTKPYLEKAFLSIAPLRFGAGMKGKVTEALAAGLPVVTTTFGAQGLGAVPGKHLMVSDDAETFAANIMLLLADPELAASVGLAGQEHIRRLCSVEVVEVQLNAMVGTLMARRASGPSPASVGMVLSHWIAFTANAAFLCLTKSITKPYQFLKIASKRRKVPRAASQIDTL